MRSAKTAREQLHQAIGQITPFSNEEDGENVDDEDMPEAGVLTGWVLVAEWQGTDGNRWLSKISGTATGDKGLPMWHERGFCNEVVDHWPEATEDDS